MLTLISSSLLLCYDQGMSEYAPTLLLALSPLFILFFKLFYHTMKSRKQQFHGQYQGEGGGSAQYKQDNLDKIVSKRSYDCQVDKYESEEAKIIESKILISGGYLFLLDNIPMGILVLIILPQFYNQSNYQGSIIIAIYLFSCLTMGMAAAIGTKKKMRRPDFPGIPSISCHLTSYSLSLCLCILLVLLWTGAQHYALAISIAYIIVPPIYMICTCGAIIGVVDMNENIISSSDKSNQKNIEKEKVINNDEDCTVASNDEGINEKVNTSKLNDALLNNEGSSTNSKQKDTYWNYFLSLQPLPQSLISSFTAIFHSLSKFMPKMQPISLSPLSSPPSVVFSRYILFILLLFYSPLGMPTFLSILKIIYVFCLSSSSYSFYLDLQSLPFLLSSLFNKFPIIFNFQFYFTLKPFIFLHVPLFYESYLTCMTALALDWTTQEVCETDCSEKILVFIKFRFILLGVSNQCHFQTIYNY